jgi:hypothetical protein
MINIKNFIEAQKVMWVKRLLSTGEASWKALPKLYLDKFVGFDTFKCNIYQGQKCVFCTW